MPHYLTLMRWDRIRSAREPRCSIVTNDGKYIVNTHGWMGMDCGKDDDDDYGLDWTKGGRRSF